MAKRGELVLGQHRSLALAERHARALQREHARPVEIISRTNAKGEHSARGQFYTFRIQPAKRKPKSPGGARGRGRTEFVLHFDYGDDSAPDMDDVEAGEHLVRFQVHVIAPKGTTDERAIKAVEFWNQEGKAPKGFKVKSIFYGHPKYEAQINKRLQEEIEGLKQAAIYSGRARVSGKHPVRSNRGTRKKATKR